MKDCIFCGLPLEERMVDVGLGTENLFAHPSCYWANEVNSLETKVSKITSAINEYYTALHNRENGFVAMDNAFQKIEQALGMSWEYYKKNI